MGIIEIEKEVEQDKWIRVDERLPDYDVQVLWLRSDGYMFVESIDKDDEAWWNSTTTNEIIITHWASLPQPPKQNLKEKSELHP